MHLSKRQVHERRQSDNEPLQSFPKTVLAHLGLGMVILMAFSALSGRGQQNPPPRPSRPLILPAANPLPDVNTQMEMDQRNAKRQSFEAANAERKRQMDDESTKLLILANDLKSKTDKLGKAPLTPTELREAAVIEALARDLKEKMKLTVGGN